MVTLPEEIAFIWRRPKTLSALLFLLNRYAALLGNIAGLVVDFQPIISDESCSKYTLYRQLALFLQGMIVCVIMAIRVYALYSCSKRLLTWMIIVTAGLAGLACAGTIGKFSGNVEVVPGIGCNEKLSTEVYVILIAVLRLGLSYVASFVFDLFIFILTVYRICKTSSLLRLSLVTRRNIIDIMFHDGKSF
ncbi:hypothetical protein DEU56DRAFT_798251, partial [Suillus clintonianus]|uniref:uncharacterized protein n=1 Tax=Suillus clintonianus TaxID=1904413 RepID=UPI001B8787F3